MNPDSHHFLIPNPLLNREPELVERLTEFRLQVNDMLLDKLAGTMLRDPSFRFKDCPHPVDDVKATAIVLRMLTKPSWDQDDLNVFDACWRTATFSDLFANEFEAERHRIQYCVQAVRIELLRCESAIA